MENYIRVYDNVISNEYCDKLIQKFENNPEQHLNQDRKHEDSDGTIHWKMSFSQIHMAEHYMWSDDVNFLIQTFQIYVKRYKEDCGITDIMWPSRYSYESMRLKKYLPNDKDEFQNHVDVKDYTLARRFLVFFVYLDDNEKGQTSFSQYDFKSPCKKGSLLIFPPLWPWLHAGEKPINKPKYIVGSYLHYMNGTPLNQIGLTPRTK